MTDREKLTDLLTDVLGMSIGFKVDHLLANGVTVPKRGRWIIHSSGHGANATNWAECSECHVCGSPQWKVCPVCETRMENHSAINIEEVDFDYAAEDDNA